MSEIATSAKIAASAAAAAERRAALTPAGLQRRSVLARRRLLLTALTALSSAAVLAAVALALGFGASRPDAPSMFSPVWWSELRLLDLGLLLAVALSAPWTLLGFWTAAIGFMLTRLARDPLAAVSPVFSRRDLSGPIAARVAVLMTIRHEVPQAVFARLRAIRADLDAGGQGARFDVFVLSDSREPEAIAAEEAAFAAARDALAGDGAAAYRRRERNDGFKAGNIREWVDRWGADYDFMLTLDADSVIGGRLVERMARAMTRRPRLGVLQSLCLGAPSGSAFGRLMTFGARLGSRPLALGSAWWQGDCGPYWGHNAMIRVDAFREHCRLPELGGRPPFGGPILSHDAVEAALMRRAGYEVRVWPEEEASFEAYPVTLFEFLQREQRWCNGNLQYVGLLGLPGLTPTSRAQLFLAVMMYVAPIAWVAMLVLGGLKAAQMALAPAVDWARVDGHVAGWLFPADAEGWRLSLGLGLFAVMFAASLGPKLFGLADLAFDGARRARFGGSTRIARGAGLDLLFSILLAPIVALHLTLFVGGLLLGRVGGWGAQRRVVHGVGVGSAARRLAPQLLFGGALTAALVLADPWLLLIAAPVLLGLLLAPIFAAVTASRPVADALAKSGAAATPELIAPSALSRAAESA